MRGVSGRHLSGAGRKCALVAAILVSLSAGARASMLTIDDFSQPDPFAYVRVPTGSSQLLLSQSAGSVVGGQRDVLVDLSGAATPSSAVALIGDYSGVDALQFGTNGTRTSVLTLQYSGQNNTVLNPAALVNAYALGQSLGTGIDLTDGGTNDRFLIHFLSVNAANSLDVTVIITSPSGGQSVSVLTSSGQKDVASTPQPVDFYFPFSAISGTASLTNVDSIRFVFNSVRNTPNIDFEMQLIAAVPEPAGATLASIALAAAVFGAWSIRRRGKQHAPDIP